MSGYYHQDLTDWERRMLALADLPQSLRDQALFDSSVKKSLPLYSLNNVPGSAPPSGDIFVDVSNMGQVSGGSQVKTPHYRKVQGPCSMLVRYSGDWSPEQKRGLMLSEMREWFPGFDWSNSVWNFIKIFKDASRGVFGIKNDERFRPYRVHNFMSCYWRDAHGWTYTNQDQVEDVYRRRFRCCEPGCLDCRDTKRGILAREWLDVWKQIVEKHPGCPGFMEVVFTLPEELEDIPLKLPEVAKSLQDGVHGIIRNMLGVGTVGGTRSNVLCHFSVHPIGDKDLFRDRYHIHADVLPCQIRKSKDGSRGFEWLRPARIAEGHKESDWKIDLAWLQAEYNLLLKKVFGDDAPKAICPQVSFTSYSEDSRRYRKCREKKDRIFWGIAAHKLKYSMRGFGKDIEKAVLRSDEVTGLCVLKCQRGDSIHWQVSPVKAVSQRFKWIKEKNHCHTRGFGRRLKEYADILGFDVCEPGDVPEVLRADAKVEIIREKRFDKKSEKVKWVRDEIYNWRCPITGEDLRKSKRDLKPWKGG